MFVSLKKRLSRQKIACGILAVIIVIVAWEGIRMPFNDHFAEGKQPSLGQGSDVAPPQRVIQEPHYDLRQNWPFAWPDNGTFSSGKDASQICVTVIACSDTAGVLTHYVLFVGNAAQKGYPLQHSYSERSLEYWQSIAASNACFINEWPAYIAGALLWFAYDDGHFDISAYNDAIRRMCPESAVYDRPQP